LQDRIEKKRLKVLVDKKDRIHFKEMKGMKEEMKLLLLPLLLLLLLCYCCCG